MSQPSGVAVSSVPLPKGFRAAGLFCGVKKDPTLLDLALLASDRDCVSAGVFTTNLVHGAPVKISRERIRRETSRAIVLNSGNSNACTGEQGLADARWMTELVAKDLGCAAEDVLVCSTGVIGRFLPKEKLAAGIPQAVQQLQSSPDAFLLAARAIMTTDTVPKLASRQITIGGQTVTISGIAKGAAMIAPNMATMLCAIVTDARLSVASADRWLRHAVDRSFNCISVEGHMSTSDTVLLLANGASGVEPNTPEESSTLQQALSDVAADLAQAIIRDAEGADHLVTIDVKGFRTREEAFRIAKSIADSPLVKTAITGADPNWGRIVSAAGYAGVPLVETDLSLTLNGFRLYEHGTPLAFDARTVSQSLRDTRDVSIILEAQLGSAQVRFWTCDLTAEYVRLNADYTT